MGENPELIAMARRIAQDNAPAVLECLFGGSGSDTVKRVVHDGLKAAALAAIIETQERDAVLAESKFADKGWNPQYRNASLSIATAIRSGQHYGKASS